MNKFAEDIFSTKEPIIVNIYILLAIFLFTIGAILFVDNYFDKNYISKYQERISNQERKQRLGNILQKNITTLNLEFKALAEAEHENQVNFYKNSIEELISSCLDITDVLWNGGEIIDTRQINFYNRETIEESIIYKNNIDEEPDYRERTITQVKAINPKILELNDLFYRLNQVVNEKVKNPLKPNHEYEKEIAILLKKSETLFSRTEEIVNKLYFDINNSVNYLFARSDEIIRKYNNFKYLSLFIICILTILVTLFIIRSIRIIVRKRNIAEASNRKLTKAVEQSPVSILITDVEGIIEYVNKSFERVSGYPKEEVIGLTPSILNSGLVDPVFFRNLWNTIKNGKPWSGEFCNRKKDGSIFWENAVISPVKDDNGVITHFIAVKEDITEKRKLVKDLEESNTAMQTILENIPVGVIMVDDFGKIVEVNNTASQLLGFNDVTEANSKLPGENLNEYFLPLVNTDEKNLTKNFNYELIEMRMIGKDFQERDILRSIIPIRLKNRQVSLQAFMDITSQKEAERKEKEANRAKSEFLANMSHEIRTPLNGIIGATEILGGMSMEEEQDGLVNIIGKSCDNLLNIINDILDFSKIEAGKLTIEKYPFNLRSTIEYMMEQLAFRAGEKNIELINIVDDNVPGIIAGDEGRLIQILINLVGNAVKFTEKGHVLVRVVPEEIKDNGIVLHFSIEDTGIGIEKEKINKIFESFTQADGSTTRKFGGTGLGTTISKMLVELMGGKIWAESPNTYIENNEKYPGTIFHFTVKCEAVKTESLEKLTLDNLGIKALLIDDNKTNLAIQKRSLANWKIKSESIYSAESALEHLQSNPQYDLILLDFNMPNMDGFGFADKMKELNLAKTPKIVLLTSDHMISQEEAKRHGIEKVLVKPIKQSRLYNTILHLFGTETMDEKKNEKESGVLKNQDGLILLVEDNLINQKIAEKMLKGMGFTIDIANNGQEAVDMSLEKQYDIIFMDVQMPVMNGLDATREIRKLGNKSTIIAMTANAMKGDREVCIDAGMDDYIGKPVKLNQLSDLIKNYLTN